MNKVLKRNNPSETVRLRAGLIDRVRKYCGLASDEAIARAMGMNSEKFSLVANGIEAPGMDFAVGLWKAFGFTPGESLEIVKRAEENQQTN